MHAFTLPHPLPLYFPCNMLIRDSIDEAEPCFLVRGARKLSSVFLQQYLPFSPSVTGVVGGWVKLQGLNPDPPLVLANVRTIVDFSYTLLLAYRCSRPKCLNNKTVKKQQ